jgi:alkanesulfonate monooxygenase
MKSASLDSSIELFSTCPPSNRVDREDYVRTIVDVARWSERYGCKGILVYTDNSLIDPWLVAHIIVQQTKALCPLVAVQPVYTHPYTVAKLVTSFAHLYGRRLYLNMVAGGFTQDLTALNDPTPHDRRYDRLREYTLIIRRLLTEGSAATFRGEFYAVERLKLTPSLPPELYPGIFVSGSSDAGLAAARAMGATAIEYPKPAREYADATLHNPAGSGIRVGIIAREADTDAWTVARERFPEDRKGQITHQLAMKVSDSVWHKQLSQSETDITGSPYWLVPFQNYKTFCPYLVGSYRRVGDELARYISVGYRSFILDVPPNAEELEHINAAFTEAAVEVPK